jgi:hypothetical protein
LLQLEFVDRLVGELVVRMKRAGVFDKSLIALMSDHGESFDVKKTPAGAFRLGELSFRRAVTPRNIEDIAGIAMFVKYPDQHDGDTDDRFVRHTDLLPTILRAVGLQRPGGLIGSDLRDTGYHGHADVAVEKQDGRVISLPASKWLQRVAASRTMRLSLFGSGEDSLFTFGPAPTLLGVPVAELQVEPRGKLRANVEQRKQLDAADPGGAFLPAQVFGSLSGGEAGGRTLAFGLNGVVEATAPSFRRLRGTRLSFSAMLPPERFRRGANQLQIFEVLDGRHVRLVYG